MGILASIQRKERPWDQVSQIIGFAHTLIHHQGIVWIQTDIQITMMCVFVLSHGKERMLMFETERTRSSQWRVNYVLMERGFADDCCHGYADVIQRLF